jgi:SHS2 domain-containing protein
MIQDALGLGASGKRKMGGGFISMELSYKPGTLPHVSRPFEDEVRRDVICPHCTLDQTVFGLATWCADCGKDIFMIHVSAELAVTQLMVNDVARRQESLGKRVAAKDLENCLEDAVSIFEASTKAIVRRALIERGETQDQIDMHFKKIGNSFQSIQRTKAQLKDLFAFDLGSDPKWNSLSSSFEKRHPVTHNLGVIDRKYLEKEQEAGREGREVRITGSEVQDLLVSSQEAVAFIHKSLIRNAP